MRYVVTKNFQDKMTGEYYGIGAIYETISEKRASDLERSGYIAEENTEIATLAMQQAGMQQAGMQQSGMQAGSQAAQQMQQQIQKDAEAYTIVDGKRVPVKEALKAEEMYNENITVTGITKDHDNTTEPVKAGATAQNSQQNEAMQAAKEMLTQNQQQQTAVRSKQSGQKAVGKELKQAGQQVQQQEQQDQQTAQQEQQKAQQQAKQAGQQAQGSTVNKALEQKAQQFNEAAPLDAHAELNENAQTSQAAEQKTKANKK
jgi:hypothetical protein